MVGLFSYLVAGVQDTLSGCLLDVSKVVVNGTPTLEGRTGRGDTCTASFLVARGRGMDLADAAAFAAEVTSPKMQYRGSYRG